MSPRGRRALRRGIFLAIIVAAIVVVVLIALVADNVLVLPSNSPAPVTISSVHLVIEEQDTSSGAPWFGPSSINYTWADGYPVHVAPGGTWSVVWQFINFDDVAHTVRSVIASSTPAPPPGSNFTLTRTTPPLPYTLPAGSDDGLLSITVAAPSDPGATFAVTLVVDTEPVS